MTVEKLGKIIIMCIVKIIFLHKTGEFSVKSPWRNMALTTITTAKQMTKASNSVKWNPKNDTSFVTWPQKVVKWVFHLKSWKTSLVSAHKICDAIPRDHKKLLNENVPKMKPRKTSFISEQMPDPHLRDHGGVVIQ